MASIPMNVEATSAHATKPPSHKCEARQILWRSVFWAYAACAVLIPAIVAIRIDQPAERDPQAMPDPDVVGIFAGIRGHMPAASTLVWWHGTWVGPFRYWRPLSSLIFWAEYHIFGPHRQDLWELIEVVSDLLAVALLATFVYRLTRSHAAAALAIVLFAGYGIMCPANWLNHIGIQYLSGGRFIPVARWKDGPDCWSTACVFGSLLLGLRRRWMPAVGIAAMGAGFKETGWLIFPMLLATAIYDRSLRSITPRTWIVTLGTVGALAALRASAGADVFYGAHVHANHYGWTRYVNEMLDFNLGMLQTTHWPIPVLGLTIAWTFLTPRLTLFPRIAIIGSSIALFGGAVDYSLSRDWIIDISSIFDPANNLPRFLFAIAYGLIMLTALREASGRRLIVCLAVITALAAIPIVAVIQVDTHMLYVVDACRSALLSVIIIGVVRPALAGFPRVLRNERFPAKA